MIFIYLGFRSTIIPSKRIFLKNKTNLVGLISMDSKIFNLRTADQGSFIWYPESFDSSNTDFTSFFALTPNQKATISALVECASLKDEESTVDLLTIMQNLDIKLPAFNSRIRALEKMNIIKTVPFEFSNKSLRGRIKCITFNLIEEVFEELAEKGQNRKSYYAEKRSSAAALDRVYNEAGFTRRPDALTAQIATPTDTHLSLVEQAVAPLKSNQSKLAKEVWVSDVNDQAHKLTVEVQSHSRVTNVDDLMNQYAMLTLTLEYHSLDSDSYIANGTLPVNATPIHVDDIVRIRKKFIRSIGSNYRDAVRESIMAMKQTTYDVMGLQSLFADGVELKQKYMSRQFRIFDQCSPLSDYAPKLISNTEVEFGRDASIYVVKWPDDVFERLIHGDIVFAFPANSLSVHTMIFVLYLRFRVKLRKVTSFSELLEKLQDQIASGTDSQSFRESLKTHLLDMNRLNDKHLFSSIEGNVLSFNIWGYHGSVDFNEKYIHVTVDQTELLLCCDIDPETQANGNKQIAPTKHNRLSNKLRPYLQIHQRVTSRLAADLNFRVSRYAFSFTVGERGFEVSHYSTKSERDSALEVLQSNLELPLSTFNTLFDQHLEKVELLHIHGKVLTKSKFAQIREALRAMYEVYVKPSAVLNSISRKSSFHDDVFNFINDEIEVLPPSFYLSFSDHFE